MSGAGDKREVKEQVCGGSRLPATQIIPHFSVVHFVLRTFNVSSSCAGEPLTHDLHPAVSGNWNILKTNLGKYNIGVNISLGRFGC